MPSGMAVASSGPMLLRPVNTSVEGSGGRSPIWLTASETGARVLGVWPVATAIQYRTDPATMAARPPGIPNGRRTFAVQLIRMTANATNATNGMGSHIWNAGRIEMNVMEMPASVPSIAARGVNLRMYG